MVHLFKPIIKPVTVTLFGVIGVGTAFASSDCDEKLLTFEDWRDWQQITQKPVKSVGHSNNWVGIFVNELANETYRNAGALYPVCAKIVKPIYDDADGKSVRKLTIMVKMPDGFDAQNGNWWYATSDPSGSRVVPKRRRADCISCHEQAAKTDYLFSEDVLEAEGK